MRTIAKNNSKREGSEEMAEVAELPQAPEFHTVKTRRGSLTEMCLIRPLKSSEALSLLSRLLSLPAHC